MIRLSSATLIALICASFLIRASTAGSPDSAQLEFFEKRIRPLLAENCFQCHSDGPKQKANLRLDSRAAILKGGDNGPAIVPGAPEKSRLIKAVGYLDPDLRMPPRKKLNDEQIADLTAWVKMGAPWPESADVKSTAKVTAFNLAERKKHWAWQSIQHPTPPSIKQAVWPRNPIDQFILAKLEAAGLKPAAAADKRTLLRRVTFDLIGLPPTPAEIDAFLADDSANAYQKVVERLLASPHYGERWARHWLDLVRYADTQGHEFDYDMPEAYRYRDYVIRALNADVPYDQFVMEHVAGDLLPQPRRHPMEGFNESIIGTGFWYLGEGKHSPVDIRAEGADRTDNQLDVFSKTFFAMTVSCARCHDHKFDAISTKDYYALSGFIRSSRYQRAFLDAPAPWSDRIKTLSDVREKIHPLAVAATVSALKDSAIRLTEDLATNQSARNDWQTRIRLAGSSNASSGLFEDFNRGDYREWFVTGHAFGDRPTRGDEIIFTNDAAKPIGPILDAGIAHSGLLSNALKGTLRSRTFTLDKTRLWYRTAGKGSTINLIIDGFQIIREPIYGGLTMKVDNGDKLEWRAMDVSMWHGHRAYIEFIDDGPGYIAVDQILHTDGGPPPESANRIGQLTGKSDYRRVLEEIIEQWRTGKLPELSDAADRRAILNDLIRRSTDVAKKDVVDPQLTDALKQLHDATARLPEPLRAMAIADGTGENEHVFVRGSHKNLGEEAPRRFLEAIVGNDHQSNATGSGRLELAHRLVQPSDPLLARVLVNRLWKHHFGEGLVRSVDNFGALGETPSHPELLDWLATEFMKNGASMKHMHRLMVLSSTYQMNSLSPEGRGAGVRGDDVDPQNKLLHRMPIQRLEAEAIRDSMLAISGRLDSRMYGPGAMPHLTPFMAGRGRPGSSGPLDGDGRRSIYISVRRNFLTPMFLAFDYPIPFTTIGKRSVSNVPAQALTLMNNPFVLQQAELWAKRVLSEPSRTPSQRIETMYLAAFARPPTADEVTEAISFLEEQAKQYGKMDDVRAWTDFGHVLMNVKEFVFVN